MSVDHSQLIKLKLTNLSAYLDELAPYLKPPLKDYLEVPGQRRIVERLVQVIVESTIDINGLLVRWAGEAPPATAYLSFEAVHRLGIIDDSLLDRFRRYVGLRNRIVHDYDVLDNKIVYHAAKRLIEDATKYGQAVNDYLARKPVSHTGNGGEATQ